MQMNHLLSAIIKNIEATVVHKRIKKHSLLIKPFTAVYYATSETGIKDDAPKKGNSNFRPIRRKRKSDRMFLVSDVSVSSCNQI